MSDRHVPDDAVTAESKVWLVRHGETEWSRNGRHTGSTDLPLTELGEAEALKLGPMLAGMTFDTVLCSPRQRARRTAELAGFTSPEIVDDLAEWDYGSYEGRTRVAIHEERPDWSIWADGAPDGESPAQISARVDRVIARCRALEGRVLVFAHGHVLRTLAARWVAENVDLGQHLDLDTATVSVLGIDRGVPIIHRWNSAGI